VTWWIYPGGKLFGSCGNSKQKELSLVKELPLMRTQTPVSWAALRFMLDKHYSELMGIPED
jgi:hypothetical protein